MDLKKISLVLVVFISLLSCEEKATQITNTKDYAAYLNASENKTLQKAEKEYAFWQNKYNAQPGQYVYLSKIASSNAMFFEATANISSLKKAEENLKELNEKTQYNNAGNLRALAHNYISQHKFKPALELLLKAEKNGEKLSATKKMLFDVYLELGNDTEAQKYLNDLKNFSDFDYLIRLSKWNDHKSNLEGAITYMEKAMAIAETSNLEHLKIWSYTNLADFYGHNGEVEKAYNLYLKTLELDPNNAYAKKGIAWIVFSYEKNTVEAERIISTILKDYKAPDYYLFQAEIAEFNNDETKKEQALSKYFQAVKNEAYGDMYNVYSAKLLAEKNPQEALKLANIEVENRPTALSYDLLAWTNYKAGNLTMALQIIESKVINFTTEPEALRHAAEIYKASGNVEKANEIKKELLEAEFELGPVAISEVKNI
jgi:predicted Zn-dependent protease